MFKITINEITNTTNDQISSGLVFRIVSLTICYCINTSVERNLVDGGSVQRGYMKHKEKQISSFRVIFI